MATYESQWNNGGMEDPTPRERRERPRMSDINRAVDKAEKDQEPYVPGRCFGNQPGAYETQTGQAGTSQTLPYLSVGVDKNTPESLKTLRWEIYDLLDRYDADYGRTIKFTLMQEVERLFQEYTHS